MKFKPKKAADFIGSEKINFTPLASSVDGTNVKDRTPNSVRGPVAGESIVQNKFLEQIRQKEQAKQKLAKQASGASGACQASERTASEAKAK